MPCWMHFSPQNNLAYNLSYSNEFSSSRFDPDEKKKIILKKNSDKSNQAVQFGQY